MKKYFLISILSLAASAALIVLLALPLYDRIVALRANIAEKEKIVTELTYLIQKIDQWRNQINERGASIEKLNLALPSEKAIPDFIVSLRSLAGSAGMILTDITIQTDKKVSVSSVKNNIGTVDAALEINGTYPAFKTLLSGLEKNVRVADIQSINFESAPDSGASVLNFTINLKIYYNK